MTKIIVIKIGGEIVDELATIHRFCTELASVIQAGIKIILVHGGGMQITKWGKKLSIEPNIINGCRVTDQQTIEVVKMTLAGKVNIEIVSVLQSLGVNAVGLSGVDGKIIHACKRPPQKIIDAISGKQKIIDYGFVGDVITTHIDLLSALMEKNYLPVLSSLSADEKGTIYNINADTFASAIATAFAADRWIVVTNVDGIYDNQKNILPQLTCAEANTLIKEGMITGGMIPKIQAIISAIKTGIKSVHIINGIKPGILLELIAGKAVGTVISSI